MGFEIGPMRKPWGVCSDFQRRQRFGARSSEAEIVLWATFSRIDLQTNLSKPPSKSSSTTDSPQLSLPAKHVEPTNTSPRTT